MKKLIEALQIMARQGDVDYPTNCEHDELRVYPKHMDFTQQEFDRLEELGFFVDEEQDGNCFISYKYGSC